MKKSFTLIEILVVATIIGLLVAIGSVSYSSLNKSSRDAKRKADLEQIRAALELYKSNNSNYPTSGWINTATSGTVVYDALVPTYLKAMPLDPKANGGNPNCSSANFAYYYQSTATGYDLVAGLENQTTTNCPAWCAGGAAAPPSCYVVNSP